MKLNYKRTICVGFAFFLICAFWQAYDNTIPLILTNKFGMSQAWSGVIMALDNILALFLLPLFVQRNFGIELPGTLEIIILLFIFSAEILGEIQAYYTYFHGWDTMLHTLNGFLCAAIGFSLVDLFNRNERFSLSLSPVFMAIVAFCFSMTIGVLWEFFECIMDSFFLLDMQKDTIVHDISTVMLDPTGGNKITAIRGITDVIVVAGGKEIPLGLGGYLDIGLLDTMKDLFVNFIGAFVFSIIGYFYVKNRGRGRFARRFIPKVLPEEPVQADEEDSGPDHT